MTLGFYTSYSELFTGCVLHFTGVSETNLGFPIIPSGVTVTPAGTWSNPLDLGTNKILKTFDGSTNYIEVSDNAAWDFGSGDFTVCWWDRRSTTSLGETILSRDSTTLYSPYLIGYPSAELSLGCYISADGSSYGIANGVTMGSFTLNTWAHFALIRSGNTFTTYKNGTVTTSFSSTSAIYDNSNALSIAKAQNMYYFNGNTKDLLIYKGRALTLPELTTIMRLTHPTTGSGLLPLYQGVRGIE
ncbi:MAG: LamG-like jellyroll fold domain-containing protein [Dehalococcoidales bacterium]|jgi:hypothetical protein